MRRPPAQPAFIYYPGSPSTKFPAVNVGGGRECSLSLLETTAICRELTKLHEEFVRGTAAEVLAALQRVGRHPPPEIVGQDANIAFAHPQGRQSDHFEAEPVEQVGSEPALIGKPVYLDCWVKVLPHWRKSSTALTRFGFPESEMS